MRVRDEMDQAEQHLEARDSLLVASVDPVEDWADAVAGEVAL